MSTNNLEDFDENTTVFIHLVCHTHDDVGWNLIPEDYYKTKVKQILTKVIEALYENLERKFSFAEIFYFEKWWID